MGSRNRLYILLPLIFLLSGCFRYSFTGTSIPQGVNSIFIPFFADQTSGGVGDLSDRLNRALIDRFVDSSPLQLAGSRDGADAVLEGSITQYRNQPFSVSGDEEASLNEITIFVQATYRYTDEENEEWSQTFDAAFRYDPNTDAIAGENEAADQALELIAEKMFNAALGNW